MFLKAQYVGDDWPQNVTAIAGDTDPVCVNVYTHLAKQEHVVIDCMVKENNLWKVQSFLMRIFQEIWLSLNEPNKVLIILVSVLFLPGGAALTFGLLCATISIIVGPVSKSATGQIKHDTALPVGEGE
jgi:hypothetical protein